MIESDPYRLMLVSADETDESFLWNALERQEVSITRVSTASEALDTLAKSYPRIVVISENSSIPTDIFARKVQSRYPFSELLGLGFSEQANGITANLLKQDIEFTRLTLRKVINDHLALAKCKLVGKSPAIKEVANSIVMAAPTDLTVLLIGPSGVGKEVAARAIHDNSKRTSESFFSINCGALTEGLLSSELFGHEKGAFTGAVSQKSGVFESAGSGTIFLDEIGEISPETQVKLLRVLEDGTFYRVGGTKMLKSKARVIAATNKNLYSEASIGRFRQDLYYRLRVVEISIPPLHQREEDIPVIAEKFINNLGLSFHEAVSPDAVAPMLRHDWPGNARELRNFLESRIALSAEKTITREDVEEYISSAGYERRHLPVTTGLTPDSAERQVILQAIMSLKSEISSLRELIMENLPASGEYDTSQAVETGWNQGSAFTPISPGVQPLEELEKEAIRRALIRFNGNRREAAKALGIGERTLYRKITKYGIQ